MKFNKIIARIYGKRTFRVEKPANILLADNLGIPGDPADTFRPYPLTVSRSKRYRNTPRTKRRELSEKIHTLTRIE